MAKIVYEGPSGEEYSVPIGPDNPVVTVGRAKECTIRSNKKSVSRNHAEFRYDDGVYEIVDLDSSNGTWLMVDGKRHPVSPREYLTEEDEVWCGDFILNFHQSDENAPDIQSKDESSGGIEIGGGDSEQDSVEVESDDSVEFEPAGRGPTEGASFEDEVEGIELDDESEQQTGEDDGTILDDPDLEPDDMLGSDTAAEDESLEIDSNTAVPSSGDEEVSASTETSEPAEGQSSATSEQLEQKQQELEALEQDYAEAQRKIEDLKQKASQAKELRSELEERDREIKELRSELEDVRQDDSELEELEQERDQLQSKVESLEDELEAQKSARAEAISKKEEFEDEVVELKQRNEELENELVKLENSSSESDELEELEVYIDELEAERDELKDKLSDTDDTGPLPDEGIAQLQEELTDLQQENQRLREQLDESGAAGSVSTSSKDDLRDKIEQLIPVIDAVDLMDFEALSKVDRLRLESALRDADPYDVLEYLADLVES